uniref:Uncharacterized protein n=1 Tax=Arcella intermedia TaxID=1963864 RepID=A0A6B2LQP0_9EUKA
MPVLCHNRRILFLQPRIPTHQFLHLFFKIPNIVLLPLPRCLRTLPILDEPPLALDLSLLLRGECPHGLELPDALLEVL